MRVVFEGAIFEMLPVGGIARYFTDIINRLPESITPIVLGPEEASLAFSNPHVTLSGVRTKAPLKMLRRFWRKSQHRLIDQQMDSLSGDLHHWTYYSGLCQREIRPGNVQNVITVYDFIHESFPELDPSGAHSYWKRKAIESADHICCISQTTHDDLCDRFPEVASRASVTMLGNSFVNVVAEPVTGQLANRPYVLFVGRRDNYKNFQTLWHAWQSVRSRVPELALVIVGPPIKRREARGLGMKEQEEGVIHLGGVSDPVLKGLYQHCRAFVFPSKEEGFGLPAVEAMESGAPVIASTCPALREVLGNVGHYFDAHDVDSLADLLVLADLERLPHCEKKLQLGLQRASELSWQKTVEQTVAAYRTLRGSSPIVRAA
ncbi:glycosyltransferase family 4 protein [Novipirellula artificiosorum]|uniref:D-inositol 3-phosphate glycosyltransferase n=1 Tax=Novipirellula artificiosorum TaxID=2528016 RepID=A0A5C6DFC9_9BACT|nr:glycosyltransferase family 1 protein [Novipirellula artificiosorum]TWU35953.1 D-inositol 3-phosphate glycosyltransferase [Novipirellula artificiosorum]